jgi:hypothetical protein
MSLSQDHGGAVLMGGAGSSASTGDRQFLRSSDLGVGVQMTSRVVSTSHNASFVVTGLEPPLSGGTLLFRVDSDTTSYQLESVAVYTPASGTPRCNGLQY